MANGSKGNPQERQGRLDRLFVINQTAGPLMRELLEDLSANGVRCELLTGWLDAEPGRKLPFRVVRGRALVKAPAWERLWTWARFTLQAIFRAIARRRAAMLVVTNPPWTMLAMPLLKRLFGCRYVLLVYDVYPDVLERMGAIRREGGAARFWRWLSRRSMLAAEGVITIGEHMAETLRAHLRPGERCEIRALPNWADTDFIRPREKASNPFAQRHGLAEKFVVLYSGAFGATHDTESILQAAETLLDLPMVHFLLIGGGTRQREVAEMVARKNLPNVSLLPLQPFAELPFSLTAADCAIVSLDEGYQGVSVPSKTYYALAAGAALLAISPAQTELADLVRGESCGVHVLPHSPSGLAAAVRGLYCDPELLQRMKAASRRAAERSFSRRLITGAYRDYLQHVFGRGGG